ncbi:tRNA (adenine(37)-N6)-methyltransferase [Diplonema papillatum]|nr:tRNA (adenine(37)-N6)-methyltransferase [Diplonema papillatum]|eukprot:gene9551-14821_t
MHDGNPSESVELNVIGHVESPYKQKFAIPRQPGLVTEAKGCVVLRPPYNDADIVRGVEDFTHLWIVFVFHETAKDGWAPTVRPPKLGGRERKGVFATRATHRPNPIGLSVVKFDGSVERRPDGSLALGVSGLDILHGTPLLDVKPYIPYCDSIPEAASGFADGRSGGSMTVSFSEQAAEFCALWARSAGKPDDLRLLIEQVLRQDPRPGHASRRGAESSRTYAVTLHDVDMAWTAAGDHNHVTRIVPSPLGSRKAELKAKQQQGNPASKRAAPSERPPATVCALVAAAPLCLTALSLFVRWQKRKAKP